MKVILSGSYIKWKGREQPTQEKGDISPPILYFLCNCISSTASDLCNSDCIT